MDPVLASTTLANLVSEAFVVAEKVGAPPVVLAGLALISVALLAYRNRVRIINALKNVKIEKAPDTVSDGGQASDLNQPPAKPTTGEPGGGPNGDSG